MNLLKKALLALFFVLPMGLFAQQNKFGHVNSQQLLSLMPEVETANKKLDTLNKQYTDQLQELMGEYQKKVTDFQTKTFPSDAIRNSKATEIQQMEERIMAFKEEAQKDLEQKTGEMMEPIQKKVKEAIKQVAKEGNYAYIFDSSAGSLLYAVESDDITPLLKKKLGLQ